MPITVPCPHCKKKWKLRDDYAGKRIKCPNAECGKVIAVPAAGPEPSANGSHGPDLIAQPAGPRPAPPPPPPPVAHDAEKLAADLFGDDADKPAAPTEVQTFEYTCHFCDHKWMLPVTQRGKNVLCPECRQRQKIPEKKVVKVDWRDPNAERPTLARGPELPDDLKQQQSRNVDIESLVQAGAIPEAEVEPLPLRTKLMRVGAALAGVALVAFAVVYFLKSRSEGNDNKLYLAAVDSIKGVTDDGGLPKGQPPLFRAALNTAAGEATIRLNDKPKVKEAVGRFGEARRELEDAPKSFERDYLLGDLALAVLSLGGTPEQVATEVRLPWRPGTLKGNQPQFNGPGQDVQAEVRRVLLALRADGKAADLDHRLAVVRRLARALIAKGQLELLQEILSQGFTEGEMLDAKANLYFERIRAGEPADKLAQPGEEFAPSLEQRWMKMTGPDAVATANRAGTPESKVVELALVAEFAANPKEAVASAASVVEKDKTLPMKGAVPLALVRLNHFAGKAGDKGFAESIPEPPIQSLAEAEAVRGRIAANPAGKIDTAALTKAGTTPTVGQLCAALAGCRQNGRVTRDKTAMKEYEGWPANSLKPAGLLGLTLGLQDATEKW